ncbi:hypothetical protein TNCV_3421781 [Trichonephila clavipes]|nr:hypothetical protein TNCV_3421781 [Trichonephila clavipes]
MLCSKQTLPRSSTHAQSYLGMPNCRNKVTKNGNGPSEGLFAGTPVQPRCSQNSLPLRHGGTLNSRRAASRLVWPLNWGGIEQNRTVTCMVLKAKANDRRKNSSL